MTVIDPRPGQGPGRFLSDKTRGETMMTATKMVYSWQTTKTASGGYEWLVYKTGDAVPTETLKTGVAATRATATKIAKLWMLHLKSIEY